MTISMAATWQNQRKAPQSFGQAACSPILFTLSEIELLSDVIFTQKQRQTEYFNGYYNFKCYKILLLFRYVLSFCNALLLRNLIRFKQKKKGAILLSATSIRSERPREISKLSKCRKLYFQLFSHFISHYKTGKYAKFANYNPITKLCKISAVSINIRKIYYAYQKHIDGSH